jgi:hypothetical protein
MVSCPRCGLKVIDLHPVEAHLGHKLVELGEMPPGTVCLSCLTELRKTASGGKGGVLLAEEKAKEQHRIHLWKSRVSLVKNGRQLMSQKMYSEAAVSYEKYLKILEIVFGVEKGQLLTPEKFKDSARTEELTIVASVYWDLLRIYDTSDKYGERQIQSAKQLAAFIKFTPIFPDIIKRAESFAKQAKHPSVVRSFLKMASAERPRCFIATSAFESPLSHEVQILRWWRDSYLKKSIWGRGLIKIYYRFSPPIAEILDNSKFLRKFTRVLLRYLIKCVS